LAIHEHWNGTLSKRNEIQSWYYKYVPIPMLFRYDDDPATICDTWKLKRYIQTTHHWSSYNWRYMNTEMVHCQNEMKFKVEIINTYRYRCCTGMMMIQLRFAIHENLNCTFKQHTPLIQLRFAIHEHWNCTFKQHTPLIQLRFAIHEHWNGTLSKQNENVTLNLTLFNVLYVVLVDAAGWF